MTNKILLAVVDDHTLFRQGVCSLMREYDEIEIVFEASNGKEMQDKLPLHPLPNVILMDINMPVMNGYDAAAWCKLHYPQCHILALSMFDDDAAVIKMIKAGAGGYILKESKPSEVFLAIKNVAERGVYLNEMVSGKLIRSFSAVNQVTFTQKEMEFMVYCCSELTYKEIADKMFVSPRTVDNYRESLFAKLQLKSRVGLVLYAIKQQIYRVI